MPASFLAALPAFFALVRAGFRRELAYPGAAVAGTVLNLVFGLLHCSVLLAVLAGATGDGGSGGQVRGYGAAELATFAWVGQAFLRVVWLFTWNDLAERVRTGEITSDLLRPVDPLLSHLAVDLGRAGFAFVTLAVVPVLVGVLAFPMRLPTGPVGWTAVVLSVFLATVVSFGTRYLVNLVAFWWLDVRGATAVWMVGATMLSGLAVPVHFFPDPARALTWLTPFPWMLQAPLDVVIGRGGDGHGAALLGGQLLAAGVVLGCCHLVQRRALRRLVVQGG